MSTLSNRKPRSDAALKNLPDEVQSAMFEETKRGLDATVDWLKATHGISSSRTAMHEWRKWYVWQQQFQDCESDAKQFMALMRDRHSDLSEEKIEQFGNDFFQLRAIRLDDPELFLRFRTARNKAEMEKQKFSQRERALAQKEEALKLERDKFELLKRKAEQAEQAEQITKSEQLTPEQKLEKMREVFGLTA